jgi:cbb3-type cytochrome oxidase cytochrome c subunit
MKKAGPICFAAGLAVLLLVITGFLLQAPSRGKKIFIREGCTGCHSFKGQGGIGIDLSLTAQRRSSLWITRQIKDPKKHNPDTRMPEYGHLSFLERYALARHIRS